LGFKPVTLDLPAAEPAVRAWSLLGGQPPAPASVQILKDRNASHVYRLTGAAPDGSNVIAKRCPTDGAVRERAIYQEVLWRLPVPSLRYYGLVEEQDTDFCWAFLEDAGGVRYSAAVPRHGRLAAEWLATLHSGGLSLARGLGLGSQGSNMYLGCLRSGRLRILQSLDNLALSPDDGDVLVRLAAQCDMAEALWPRIEECCSAAPTAFLHADLHAANVHVSEDCSTLLPFDWESAGAGPLAIDLALPGLDLAAYQSCVRSVWPEMELSTLEKFAVVGRLFQLLAHIDWESKGLSTQWLHRPMKHMRFYLEELPKALNEGQLL